VASGGGSAENGCSVNRAFILSTLSAVPELRDPIWMVRRAYVKRASVCKCHVHIRLLSAAPKILRSRIPPCKKYREEEAADAPPA
jgi:hypothetical protein